MIALLCSVRAECEMLLRTMTTVRTTELGAKSFVEGRLAGQTVILCAGGMGKVNAAHASTLLLTRSAPEVLIIFGIGGAYPSSGAQIGDVALAREEIAGDEGVLTCEGFRDTRYIGIPLYKTASRTIYTTFPAPESLARSAFRTLMAGAGSTGGKAHFGAFITLSTCTGTAARARELEQRHHGLCENMEGAAAAQVAALHDTAWLEVRGISNMVEDRAPETWDIPRAARAAEEAVLRILEGLPK